MIASIRHRLLLYLMIALAICSSLVGWAMYVHAHNEMQEIFDETIVQVALALKAKVDEAHPTKHTEEKTLHNEEDFLLQIWSKGGTERLYASHPAIFFPLHDFEGIKNVPYEGEDWRTMVLKTNEGIIQVAQPLTNQKAMETAFEFLVPVLLQIPLLGFVIWIVIGRSLRPLTDVSDGIKKRSPDALEPLILSDIPTEIQPLTHALNDLLHRLQESMTLQRRFIADAAHELRTPLTALRLQMDNLNHAADERERKETSTKLSAGIERSIHLAHQLLVLSKQEPEAIHAERVSVGLSPLVRECVERASSHAREKHITVDCSQAEPVYVDGHEESLDILVSNLLDNAIRYTKESGKVKIAAYHSDGYVILDVADNGTGIAENERERIFDRFFRVAGTKSSGTGLGLAIAKAIADRHDATITVHDGLAGQGVTFRVTFPPQS